MARKGSQVKASVTWLAIQLAVGLFLTLSQSPRWRALRSIFSRRYILAAGRETQCSRADSSATAAVPTKNSERAGKSGVFGFTDAVSPACLSSNDPSFLLLPADCAAGRIIARRTVRRRLSIYVSEGFSISIRVGRSRFRSQPVSPKHIDSMAILARRLKVRFRLNF